MTTVNSQKEKQFYGIVCIIEGCLLSFFLGILFIGETVELKWIGVFGNIVVLLSWFLFYRFMIYFPTQREEFKKRNARPSKRAEELGEILSSSWPVIRDKKIKQYKISIDIHKSPNWKNDGEIFLCIHNKSFFKKLWDLSVVTKISKIENGSNIELGKGVLNESFHLENRLAYVDLPFLEVSKDENKFFIFLKYPDEQNKEMVRYEFSQGEYLINFVVRKLVIFEGQKTSGVIPVRIKYEGLDKIEWKIDFLAMIDYRHNKIPSASEIVIQ